MNKVFKVIWSEARNAYVVVSEIAKNHGSKSCSTKKLLTMLIATGVMTCASMAPAMAAPNVDASATVNVGKKAAVNVAENAKVNVKKDAKVNVEESAELTVKNGAKVTFSKDAGIGFGNGAKINLGSKAGVTLADGAKLSVAKGSNVSVDKNITMGNGAVSSPYVGQTGNVAIGEKALAWNGNGLQEALMDFGQGGAKVKSFFGVPYGAEIVDGTKLPGSIAIGKNTVARSGSTMIGDHGYTGKIGDTTITPDGNGIMKYNNDVYSTTIGANSFNSGALASVTGVFSIASSKYDGDNYKFHAVQNTGATIYGSMNSIESATSDAEYSGIASSVLGFANKTQNANAALIWGTGNEVTNSVESIDIDYNGWNKLSVAEAQQKAIEAMQSSKYAGGSVMAIGGGNKADYAKYSQLTGVQNKVTGTKAKAAKYDFVNGYQNTVTNASDVTVIGIKNEVTADGNKVIGDNHKVSGTDNVIFGSADELTETTVNNTVALGHNAKVTGEGGVALGAGSVADRAAGEVGYDPTTGKAYDIENGDAPDYVWQATSGAVSVGSGRDTRQITNVAAGTEDTDAVNVAQLKKVNEEALKHSTVTNGGNITVTEDTNKDGGKEYKVALNNDITLAGDTGDFVSISGSKGTIWASGSVTAGSVVAGSVVAGSVVMDGATSTVSGLSNTTTAYDGFATTGKAATEEQLKEVATEAGKHTQVKAGTNVGIVPGETEDGTHVYTVNADGTTVSGDSNVVVTAGEKDKNNVTNYGVKLNKDLKGIESVSNGSASLKLSSNPIFGTTAELTNGQASVSLMGGSTKINGKVEVRQDGTIGGVTAGRSDKDAVNVSQLNNVKAEALKHTTLSDGKNTTVAPTVKDGQTDYKVNVAGDLTDITSVANGDAKLALNGAAGTAGIINGQGASVFMQGSTTVINQNVSIDKDGKISGVAAGTADTDAVNYGQLKNISAAATAAKTEIKGGTNIANVDQTTADDGHMVYTVNANGTTVSGDSNVVVTAGEKDKNNVTNYGVKLNKDLKGIESVSNGSASLTMSSNPIFGATAKLTNGKASVELRDSTTIINGKVQVRQDGSIGGVTAGRSDKDAVNVSQLKDVKAEAGKHTTLSNGKNTTVEAAVKDGQTDYKVNVAGDLTDISSVANGDAKLALNGAAGTAGIVNGKGASVYMQDGYTVINSKVSFDQDGKISGVAAGVNNDDAVNVSQLKKVEEAAGNANKGWNLSTNGVATEATNVKPGDNVDFSGDKNVSVSNDGTAVSVKLNKNLKDIETISNGGATLTLGAMGGMVAELANGQGASVKLFGDTTTINGKVNVYKDGRIAGVADGVNATDAVNVSQLQKAAAASAATVTDGVNTTVTTTTAEDGHVDYKVNLNKNLTGVESISNGGASLTMNGFATELANGQGASVKLFGDTTTINGKVNVYKDGRIAGVADGVNATDAVNVSQLQKAAAASAATVTDGVNTTVTTTTAEDGHVDYKVNLNKNLTGVESISNGGASLTMNGFATELANGQGASVKLFGDTTTINGKVNVYKDGRIAGVADGVNATDAVNVSQLQKAAAASATTVSDGVNTTVTATKAKDGHTDYKVNLNKDLVGIESISNGDAKLTLGGFATELANGQGASVKLFGDTTTINNAVTVYKDGRIAGVADGVSANDAVNVSQLQKAAAESATTVSDGVNTTVTATKAEDGHTDYKVNLNKDLVGIESISNGDAKLTLGGFATELANGQGASVKLFGDTTTINNAVTVYKDGRIAGVADGVSANDAVNVSQLQKAAAESATTVSDGVNTTVTATKAEDGHTDYKVNLNKDLVGIESISNGDAKLTLGGFATELTNGQGASVKLFGDATIINGKVNVYNDGRIAGVAAGINDNDAVNVGQLKEAVEAGNTDTHIKAGEYGVGTDNKVNMQLVDKNGKDAGTVTITDVAKASDVGDVNNIASDIKNQDGSHTTVVDAVNNLNNKVGDLQYSKVEKGEIADGDSTTTAIGKLDQKLTDVAATAAKHTKVVNGSNITVEETAQDGQKTYKVGLNKDILLGDITGKNVSISGTNGTIETTGYIATKDRVYADKGAKLADVDITGDTISNDKSSVKLDKEGTVTINNKVTIDGNGKVSGVADGEISATSTDAVNGGQLYKTNQAIANNATNISSLSHSISNLDNRVNKVGAGAAALAALHPLDFDPDAKWDFAAGYGNYRGTNAAAVGAYYRPNEDTMFSVGGTFGNGENMVNAGVSFKLGSGSSHVSTSRVAMAKEIKELREHMAAQDKLIAQLTGPVNALTGSHIQADLNTLFPDVPKNHWAYDYVTKLAQEGYIEGYPDGNFKGDAMMTRYEFAAVIYRAMMNGAARDAKLGGDENLNKLLKEFEPELEYIRIDTIAKDKAGNPTIQRVRTVKANTNK